MDDFTSNEYKELMTKRLLGNASCASDAFPVSCFLCTGENLDKCICPSFPVEDCYSDRSLLRVDLSPELLSLKGRTHVDPIDLTSVCSTESSEVLELSNDFPLRSSPCAFVADVNTPSSPPPVVVPSSPPPVRQRVVRRHRKGVRKAIVNCEYNEELGRLRAKFFHKMHDTSAIEHRSARNREYCPEQVRANDAARSRARRQFDNEIAAAEQTILANSAVGQDALYDHRDIFSSPPASPSFHSTDDGEEAKSVAASKSKFADAISDNGITNKDASLEHVDDNQELSDFASGVASTISNGKDEVEEDLEEQHQAMMSEIRRISDAGPLESLCSAVKILSEKIASIKASSNRGYWAAHGESCTDGITTSIETLLSCLPEHRRVKRASCGHVVYDCTCEIPTMKLNPLPGTNIVITTRDSHARVHTQHDRPNKIYRIKLTY